MKTKPQDEYDRWLTSEGPTQPAGMRVIFWIIVAIAIVLLLALGMRSACARPFDLCYTLSVSDVPGGPVQVYGFYYSPTNVTAYTWMGTSPGGVTNFWFDTTNGMPNPVYLTAQTVATNGQASTMSVPYLFDTNTFPLPVALNLKAPTGFNVRTN